MLTRGSPQQLDDNRVPVIVIVTPSPLLLRLTLADETGNKHVETIDGLPVAAPRAQNEVSGGITSVTATTARTTMRYIPPTIKWKIVIVNRQLQVFTGLEDYLRTISRRADWHHSARSATSLL